MELLAGKITLLCLLLLRVDGIKVEDNTGYSRIYVASPGIRKYTYDISHDPEGRDFTINFNPFVSQGEFSENSVQSRNGLQDPRDYDQVELNLYDPSYQEQERSNKHIQAVHAAYSKSPDEDFDLGIMGYGDFMDGPELDLGISPKSASLPPASFQPRYPKLSAPPNFKPLKFHPINKPVSPPKKYSFPKQQFNPNFGQKVQVPKVQYGFKPVKEVANIPPRQPLFIPVQRDGHLQGLGDKAYSKVFMAQGHAKDVVKLYPKSTRDFRKALFVPVVFVPGASQSPIHHNDLHNKPYPFKSS